MADYTVWYGSEEEASDFATNLIIIEAKKIGFTDSCLGIVRHSKSDIESDPERYSKLERDSTSKGPSSPVQ